MERDEVLRTCVWRETPNVRGIKNLYMAELGLMKEAAEKLIAQYHAKAPFIKQLRQAVS